MGAMLAATVRAEAAAAGFAAFGIVDLEGADDAMLRAGRRLRTFLDDGMHGDMDWMAREADRRSHPRALWPEARSAIVLGMSYAPAEDPIATRVPGDRGVISAYARGRDYHDIVKAGLKRVAGVVQAGTGGAAIKVFVDTAPLMEKPLAQAAAIGWQGKHTNLVSRTHGSWLFLGVILTAAELAGEDGGQDHCGSCRRCLDACPTAAFPAPYRLDARRCIAYLTIEHKGHIPREFRKAIGNRVFGCDDCLAVCPWNSFAQASREARFKAREATDNPPLSELLAMDDAAFRARFAGTPVKRTGRDRVVRNAAIAAGNSKAVAVAAELERLIADPSALVRAAVVWALSKHIDAARLSHLAQSRLAVEADPDVRAEWTTALKEAHA
jgi:epoxyqueuosine reductase